MHQNKYIRMVPGADTAVLFIHGIVGSPEHFIRLIPLIQLVPERYSVYNVLLDGHGGTVRDFGKSSMAKWKCQVEEVFERLSRDHRDILVVGHSMGSLFALNLALEHPERVKQLFLLAVPLCPKLGIRAVSNSLRLLCGKLREDVPSQQAMSLACGVEPTWKIWHYFGWIPRFAELLALCSRTSREIDKVGVPCVAFQSGKDELVRKCSGRVLERNRGICVYMLSESTHFYYAPEDGCFICESFRDIMDKWISS